MEWISVEDRLPDTDIDTCIVYADDTLENDSDLLLWGKGVVVNAEFYKGIWSWEEGTESYDITAYVTHWMPMPEPPKED